MNDNFDKIAPGLPAKLALLLDSILVIVAVVYVSGGLDVTIDISLFGLIFTAVGSWFIAAAVLRHYSPCTPRSRLDSLVLGGLGVASVTLAVSLTHHWTQTNNPFDPLIFAALLYLSGVVSRVLFIKPLVNRIKDPSDCVVIVGTGAVGKVTYRHLMQRKQKKVIGFLRFPDEPIWVGSDTPVMGESIHLYDFLCDHAVSEVYIAGKVLSQGQDMQEVVRVCEDVGMPFAVPLHALTFDRADLLSSSPARDGYLHYLSTRPKPVQYAIKRLVDIFASSLALALLSPLLIGVAIAIKITSPGPVIFRQVRVGLHNTHFNLLKFRSMVVDAEAQKDKLEKNNEQSGPVFKMEKDPRVTLIGRFIRKFSIDELPQLVNILRGDMTIVGPRPALPKEVAQYKSWHRRRLSARPGLTCYWQVSGRNEIGFEEWMRLDLRYVDNWSLKVDTQLILATFPVVVAGRGAS